MMEDTEMAGGKGRFRDAAAEWFTVMRGPDADARRLEFEAWLAASPAHRRAYNRITETFSYGKFLKNDEIVAADPHCEAVKPSGFRARNLRAVVGLGAVIAVCAAVSFFWAAPSASIWHESAHEVATKGAEAGSTRLRTAPGQIRSFRLADGSKVTLDAGSILLVTFDNNRRHLRLVQGRVRFYVAHESRPFVVAAGHGAVTARGTIFRVSIAKDRRVTVELFKGAVDVDLPPDGRKDRPGRVRLSPGEQYAFTDDGGVQVERVSEARVVPGPPGIRDYENVRLADLLSDANQYSEIPVVTASRDLDETKISGTFRITEPHRIARNLAQLLGLSVVTLPNSVMLARSCEGIEREICQPPS